MRISDWSSDVCSSDLVIGLLAGPHQTSSLVRTSRTISLSCAERPVCLPVLTTRAPNSDRRASPRWMASRSEEHTSELQSLMRISYAVFCLKKKIESKVKTTPKLYAQRTQKLQR